jgi:hypothetical protein
MSVWQGCLLGLVAHDWSLGHHTTRLLTASSCPSCRQVIAFLDTGAGKTFVAVLLIRHCMAEQRRQAALAAATAAAAENTQPMPPVSDGQTPKLPLPPLPAPQLLRLTPPPACPGGRQGATGWLCFWHPRWPWCCSRPRC